jgi:hypothetical protein
LLLSEQLFDLSLLLENVFLVGGSLPRGLYNAFAADKMSEIVLIHSWLIAFSARFGARLAFFQMSRVVRNGYVEFAVFTKFGFELASFLVFFVISRGELS